MRVLVNSQITIGRELSCPSKFFTQNRSASQNINQGLTVIDSEGYFSKLEKGFFISTDEANKLLYLRMMQNKLNSAIFTRKTEHALSRLEEFENLKQNWDSYDAPPIHLGSIEEAREVLKVIARERISENTEEFEFYPIPTTSGGITVYFELKSRELRVKLNPNPGDRMIIRVDKINPDKYYYEQSEYYRTGLRHHFNWLIQDDDLFNGENTWNLSPIKTTYTSESAVSILINSKTSRMKHLNHANLMGEVTKTTAAVKAWNGVDIVALPIPLQKQRLLNASNAVH